MGKIITGAPPPRSVYTFPNTQSSDYISNIDIGEEISLTVSSKGVVQLHSLPNWDVLTEKQIGKVVDGALVSNDKFILLNNNKPLMFNFDFTEIRKFKKPFISFGSTNLVSFQLCENNLYCASSNGDLFTYDSRSDEKPLIMGLTGRPIITGMSAMSETIVVSTNQGKIYIVDPRMNRTLSIIDISPFSESNPSIDGIARREETPWSLCFQFADGTAGVYDLMEQMAEVIIDPPAFLQCQKYAKLKPVFIDKYMIVGYCWSKTVNVYKKQVKSTNIIDTPVALATSPYTDGLFLSNSEGDVYEVF